MRAYATRRQAIGHAGALSVLPALTVAAGTADGGEGRKAPPLPAPGPSEIVAVYLDGETARNLLMQLALALAPRSRPPL